MSRPVWITEGGNLGTFPELNFFSIPLEVYNPTATPVTFSFLSGELPPGLQVVRSGTLQGVPVVLNPTAAGETRTYKFTIRASCQTPVVVVDKTFSFTVSNIIPPTIIPERTQLAEVFDGAPINIQLQAIESNPSATLYWSKISGELPPGLTLSTSGLISGFVGQQEDPSGVGKVGYDAQGTQVPEPFSISGNVTTPDAVTALTTEPPYGNPQQFEELPYDFTTAASVNRNYTFTVQVYDGANSDLQTYTLRVIAKSAWTSDNDINTIDDSFITVDADYKYNPVITTTITSLPVVRQDSNIAFKFDAVDFYESNLTWSSNVQSVLPQLTVNANTGWLTGHVGLQTNYKQTYTFQVTASNVYTDSNSVTTTYSSNPLVCSLTVLGDINNKIVWNSPASLGTMINGSISEFEISADFTGNLNADTSNIEIQYKLLHGFLANGAPAVNGPPTTSPNNPVNQYTTAPWTNDYGTSTRIGLPQGLNLLNNGLIVGRASFMHFNLDNNDTTIDGKSTTFDSTYTFTVQAEAVNKTTKDILVTGDKTFTITLDNLYKEPYENLYIKAFPTLDQRRVFRDIMSDPSMFPDNIIYRLEDSNFGKASELKFLAMSGIAPNQLSTYANAIIRNHHNKRLKFSDVKTAIATDPNNNYAVKYEVVYLEIIDPFNIDNLDAKIEDNLLTSNLSKITNPYLDSSGNSYSTLYPNTFDNMQTRVETAGYSAQGVIPDWMTSVQEDKTVLGFKRAIVLAYTIPGQSKTIAYRVNNRGIIFEFINFIVDRYQLDNSLSTNYDIVNKSFVNSRSTTFDVLALIQAESYDVVNYACSTPFNEINSKPYEYILNNGGIDGVTAFQDGDRLIFGKQEQLTNNAYMDGWVSYGILNDYEYTYDGNLYDQSYVVPGWLEKETDQVSPSIVMASSAGSVYIYVPHVTTQTYADNMITSSSGFIPINTIVLDAQAYTLPDFTIAWKLTLSNPIVSDASIGDTVVIMPYVIVTGATGDTITVSGLPATKADQVKLIGRSLTGNGIPSNTLISNLINNVLYVYNNSGTAVSPNVGDFIGYSVSNQRSGIWEVNIDDNNFVTLSFVKEVAQGNVVKVLGGKSFGASFLRYSTSIDQGNTVPAFDIVPRNLFYNSSGGGNGTTFDKGGTKIIEKRDQPGTRPNTTLDWEAGVYYPIGSIVKANSQTWIAVTNVMPTVAFTEKTEDNTNNRPGIPTVYWKIYDNIPVSGDKYLKFPQIGVFN
jgi:hypothetical protein